MHYFSDGVSWMVGFTSTTRYFCGTVWSALLFSGLARYIVEDGRCDKSIHGSIGCDETYICESYYPSCGWFVLASVATSVITDLRKYARVCTLGCHEWYNMVTLKHCCYICGMISLLRCSPDVARPRASCSGQVDSNGARVLMMRSIGICSKFNRVRVILNSRFFAVTYLGFAVVTDYIRV